MVDTIEQQGGLFGLSNNKDTFKGTIKRTKASEANLIKSYEHMDEVSRKYDRAYKEHLNNLERLDDFAHFEGMEKLFKKVIIRDGFKSGKIDRSLPILFRNYRIEDETTPSAFRREHIISQIDYVIETSFAGREHDLIKNITVDLGKKEFVMYLTTIDNVKKSRKIPHTEFIIDMNRTRKELREILTATKKNIARRSRLIEIGSRRSSRSKKTRKSLDSNNSEDSEDSHSRGSRGSSRKTSARKRTKHRTVTKKSDKHRDSRNEGIIYLDSNNNSKPSLKDLPSNIPSRISVSLVDSKVKNKSKTEKPSMYMRTSEKQAKEAVTTFPTATNATGGIPLSPIGTPIPGSGTTASAAILGTPTTAMGPGVIAQAQQAPTGRCNDSYEAVSCNNNPQCEWVPSKNRCFVKRDQGGFATRAPTFTTDAFGLPPPPTLAAPVSPPPTIEI
jgi:hypothetical protein